MIKRMVSSTGKTIKLLSRDVDNTNKNYINQKPKPKPKFYKVQYAHKQIIIW